MGEMIVTEVSTLGDLLLKSAELFPNRNALVLPGKQINYCGLRSGAIRIARGLTSLGVKRGEHIGILIPNCVEFAETLFGIALIGAVAVPLNTRQKAFEIGYIVAHARLAMIVTSSHSEDPLDFAALLRQSLSATPAPDLRNVIFARGDEDGDIIGADAFAALAGGIRENEVEHARRSVRVRDPALIIYTSGTTANPKGCILSHEAITRGPVERARYRLGTEPDVTWGGGPLFHIGTLAPFVGSVGVAGTFLTDTHFEPGRALSLMYAFGVTLGWPWFPAIVQGLLDHPQFDPEKLDKLRFLFVIAPPSLINSLIDVFPQTEILQACGMTETAGIFALSDVAEDARSRSESHGQPAPGVDVRIIDPVSGKLLADGEMGEIQIRGYNVMEGYWASPEKTAEALSEDGWLRTGDLYTRDLRGSLVFGGRLKDMLKVGGENVAAVEVEAFLSTHPAVMSVEVVGKADKRLDEVPVAFVELRDGFVANEKDLISYCRGRIANYKVPRAVYFVVAGSWPMSATKVDKRKLRELLLK